MRRREFISLFGGALAAWSLAAQAQRAARPVIGFLGPASAAGYAPHLKGLREGLGEFGFVEGDSIEVEYRWADNQLDRLPALAEELIRRPVAVLVAGGASRKNSSVIGSTAASLHKLSSISLAFPPRACTEMGSRSLKKRSIAVRSCERASTRGLTTIAIRRH